MVTTATGNYVCDNSTLANFKSWAQAISNAFAAFGWVQTADTGQVVWGTTPLPTGTYFYEIWKAADAVAATMPIFVKIEYGLTSTQVNIRITVGTGSSGAGVITGITATGTPWLITNNYANQGATTYPCYFSGNAGEFRMWMWGVPSAAPAIGTFFAIERSKDATGAVTNEYFTAMAACQGNNAICFQQSIKAASAGNRDTGIVGIGITSTSGTGSAFGTVAAFPVFPLVGKIGNPMLGFMTVASADVGINTSVTVASMYGSTHTYLGIGGGQFSNCIGARNSTSNIMAGLMRYE